MVLFGMEYDLQLNESKVGLKYKKIDFVLHQTLDTSNTRQTNLQKSHTLNATNSRLLQMLHCSKH